MPFIKMTAKKSNGGTAPRMTLDLPTEHASIAPFQDMEICAGSVHNDYCIICQDGSVEAGSLICCNSCPRVTCIKCIDVPAQSRQTILLQDVTFRCIVCHKEQTHANPAGAPYFGFYRNGTPVLNSFLPVTATLELSMRAQISSAPVLFVHLSLVNIDTTSGPFELAHQFLQPYFPRGGLGYCKIDFDLVMAQNASKYRLEVEKVVRDLLKQRCWSRLVMAITNHTDNDCSNPFAGYIGDQYVAAEVNNFLDLLLAPWMTMIQGAKESYLWFFSCGALVNNGKSFSALQKSVAKHSITASVAFTAPRFQPNFAGHLLLAFAEQVLIESYHIAHAFPHMLGQSNKLGRHTDVILMMTDTLASNLSAIKYCWTHIDYRPWGQNMPVQCPDCGCMDAWRFASKHRVYTFECSNDACRKFYRFEQPVGSRLLMPGKTGSSSWMSIPCNSDS